MTFTQPGNTSKTINDPSVINIQREVDNGRTSAVPYIYRIINVVNRKSRITERKIQVLACLPPNGEITLGSNNDPNLPPVDVELRCATDKGKPILISHHSCTLKRIDNEVKSEACFTIYGSKTQKQCDEIKGKNWSGSRFYTTHEEWGKGQNDKSFYIMRLATGTQCSAFAVKGSSTCIKIVQDGEIMDEIFLSIPPDWNPQFSVSEYANRDNWYWVPPTSELGDPLPPPLDEQVVVASSAANPLTQESAKSLLPGDTLHLSKCNYRNTLGQDPVKMCLQSKFSC
jgi:hypothetical protein